MIIALAGLPGVGKTTLADALAARLGAVVLNKDVARAALFGPHVDYSTEQDDFCVDVLYRTTAWLVRRHNSGLVILDGCTFTRTKQVDALRSAADDLAQRLVVIECVCRPGLAIARLRDDLAAGRHPAADRTPDRYRHLADIAEPVTGPKLVVDTARAVEAVAADCLVHLAMFDPAGRIGRSPSCTN